MKITYTIMAFVFAWVVFVVWIHAYRAGVMATEKQRNAEVEAAVKRIIDERKEVAK